MRNLLVVSMSDPGPKLVLTWQLSRWALVGSNHRPPPCKGASWQVPYLRKHASAQVRAASGFEWLLSVPIGSNELCVLFA